MVSVGEVRETLDERQDLEPVVATLLDAESPWTFEDVDVDSGTFGELVSRDFVESVDDGYRFSDRAAVERALRGAESAGGERSLELGDVRSRFDVGRLELAALGASLAFLVLMRLTSFPSVFQGDAVVLSSNDPYYYRYWLELLLSDPETTVTALPDAVALGEPLYVAVLWLATTILGGTAGAAGVVLAWYPVVSAVLTGLVLYAIAVLVTDDRRVGVATVLLLAVLPSHAFRTSVGFADHHAFDYPWLAVTALGLILCLRYARAAERDRLFVAIGAAAIALGVSGQTLAWEAGPLLIVPFGFVVLAVSIVAVQRNESVLRAVGPIVAGALTAAALTWTVHSTLGWHTTLVAGAPAVLAVGSVIVFASALAWNRTSLPALGLIAVDVVAGVLGLFALQSTQPELWRRATAQVTDRLLAPRAIAEVQSLFSDSAGWLLLFGFLLLLALPYIAWATRRALEDDRWMPLVVYGWYFLVLAAIQVRFAGQLSLFVAVFAAVAFVHLAAWIDVARVPTPISGTRIDSLTKPDRKQLFTLAGLFLLVAGLSIVQVPIKTSQITAPNHGYDAAAWMSDDSDERDLEYPDNYVFSEWGHNRMYNYFVSGESRSYGFARSNYESFATGTNPGEWYDRLEGRVGFVVTSRGVGTNESAIGTRLQRHDGSRNGSTPGLAHYRLVHVEDDGRLKVFTLVEGAEISGEAEPNATVTVRTTVTLESYSFEYVRETRADENGSFSVRVAQPGTYSVGGESVTVSEAAVRNGTVVDATSNGSGSSESASRDESAARAFGGVVASSSARTSPGPRDGSRALRVARPSGSTT